MNHKNQQYYHERKTKPNVLQLYRKDQYYSITIKVGFSSISFNVSIEKIPSKLLLVTEFRVKAFHNCLVFMTFNFFPFFAQIYL